MKWGSFGSSFSFTYRNKKEMEEVITKRVSTTDQRLLSPVVPNAYKTSNKKRIKTHVPDPPLLLSLALKITTPQI
jgi:hypothetical protein